MELASYTNECLHAQSEYDGKEFAVGVNGKDHVKDEEHCSQVSKRQEELKGELEREDNEEDMNCGDAGASETSGKETSDGNADDDDDDDDSVFFTNDEEAKMARAVGIKHYNQGRYEDALDIQYRIVRYFDKKYGATAAICGQYFLDYGISQLRAIQLKDTIDAALQPLDHDALESCFVNLDVARVCFQKQEQERGEEDIDVQLSLAEVHNAIAQLHIECEDVDSALKEYESELMTYRFIQQEAPDRTPYGRLAGVLHGIADCYMKEGDFEGAEERYTAALDEIETSFPSGVISAEVLSELRELRDDAREMKGGRFRELRESIHAQFAVQEAESLPTVQEFYGSLNPGDVNDVQQQCSNGGVNGSNSINKINTGTNNNNNPYVSQLPGEPEYSALSMPQSLTNPVQWNEHSNSMSLSLFPPQGGGGCSQEAPHSQPVVVHHAVARRKEKKGLQQQQQEGKQESEGGKKRGWQSEEKNSGESDMMKRIRTESCS